jgi:type II secretory pathway predicted ATPase ExeA
MNKKLLALYGLKWNPFSPKLPTEAVFIPQKVESFLWRIEHSQVREGGFALITGDPGTGKSVVLRLLAERLEHLREITNPSGCSPIPRVIPIRNVTAQEPTG